MENKDRKLTPPDWITSEFEKTVKEAYADYINSLRAAGRSNNGCLNTELMLNGKMRKSVQTAIGRLGAIIGAAGKRAVRELLFFTLNEAKDSGMDVTPTMAVRTAERLLGRGVSMLAANSLFGQSGRTAANKSAIPENELAALDELAKNKIDSLKDQLEEIRHHHRVAWLRSSEREALISEWRVALGGKPIGGKPMEFIEGI